MRELLQLWQPDASQNSSHLRGLAGAKGEPWEWVVLGFSVAILAAVFLFGLTRLWSFCIQPRPPRFIKSPTPSVKGKGNDGLPTSQTGSISEYSDVTSPRALTNTLTGSNSPNLTTLRANRTSGEEKKAEEPVSNFDIESVIDDHSQFISSDEEDRSEEDGTDDDIWDYSVRSFADTTDGGFSTSSSAWNGGSSMALMQVSSSASSSHLAPSSSYNKSSATSPARPAEEQLERENDTTDSEEGEFEADEASSEVEDVLPPPPTLSPNPSSTSRLSAVSQATTTSTMVTHKRRGGADPSTRPYHDEEGRLLYDI